MSTTVSTRRHPPWRSARALRAVLALAWQTRPLGAAVGLWDVARGKRVRGWNRLCRIAASHPDYHGWWRRHGDHGAAVTDIGRRPSLRICLMPGPVDDAGTPTDPAPVLDLPAPSWLAPIGPAHDWLTSRLAEAADGEWLIACHGGDRLATELTDVLAVAIASHPDTTLFYWDEDVAAPAGPADPWIKPDWDPLLHMAGDLLLGAAAIRIDMARQALARLPAAVSDGADAATLIAGLLSAAARVDTPEHLPRILTHRAWQRRRRPGDRWPSLLAWLWPDVSASRPLGNNAAFWVVAPADPPAWPDVSILIPTRDQPDLLAACLAGLRRLRYAGQVELVLIDNGTTDPAAMALLREAGEAGAVVIRDDAPFNFSRLNNRAAVVARSDILCLLNNDVEALDGDWLSAMVRHAVRPEIGAVGALLLYPDGAIQHAGVVVGMGGAAGHVQKGVRPDATAHQAWHGVTRSVSAVTAACLVVRRAAYFSAGGLDEGAFPVAFNDVDFCLKLAAQGLRNVYCAEARLIHHESRSRGSDLRPARRAAFARELAALQDRWQTQGLADPWFSPLFSRESEPCVLRP